MADVNWKEALMTGIKAGVKTFFKALLPFFSGALGGLLTGCTVGSGPNFTF